MGKEALTEGLGVGINDHLIKLGLIRHKFSIPALCHLKLLGFLHQLSPQLPLSVRELLPGLLHLRIAGSDGLLQRPRMLKPSLDQLILKLGNFATLGF
jgi:hypothetical protein